ncbi:Piso0_001768 [Millerozyma farinosa CBS 7064]|uniref:ATP synthase F(0) complex subunit e, mitochondrial n=1 Tax=Pichia sorbitophila (strain ATCC MYA-4447 / BCRC 22081 / CBS 7064 / NBRC 10061 / NRRL Y-12695) TaxID=559304 RepID=G8YLP0_PICSO|nr:Piso0_001768 [Millerozyma farinosa CBS 7064]
MSATFNVLRYSALGAGVVYGAAHRYNLEKSEHEKQTAAQWKKEEKLIKQAKQEYAKLKGDNKPQVAGGAINWEDENLDFGKALESLIQKLE